MRKTITLTARWCERLGMSDWRQHKYNIRHVKRLMRTAQNKKRSKASSPEQQEKNAALIVAAHEHYLALAEHYLSRAVVARNIHRIGDILWAREQERVQRQSRLACRAPPLKKAA